MALILEGNYSKKLGLAGYSSHQFSLTLKTEITDITQLPAEAARLYRLLQDGVDTNIRDIGYLPEANANGNGTTHPRSGNGNGNGHIAPRNGNGHGEAWDCTPKQQQLIIKIVDENRLDKNDIERLAMDRFGKGVKQLNKLEASGFIEELFERHPRQRSGNGHQPQRPNYAMR